MTQPDSSLSTRGAHLDYFGVRPTCGCVSAWLTSEATDDEVAKFAQRMRDSGRDVIRGERGDYPVDRCPHWEAA